MSSQADKSDTTEGRWGRRERGTSTGCRWGTIVTVSLNSGFVLDCESRPMVMLHGFSTWDLCRSLHICAQRYMQKDAPYSLDSWNEENWELTCISMNGMDLNIYITVGFFFL